jgi:hypothetical protein
MVGGDGGGGADGSEAAAIAEEDADLAAAIKLSLQEAQDGAAGGGAARARSHCRFVLPLIYLIPDSLTYSVALFLKRQCDRTLGDADEDEKEDEDEDEDAEKEGEPVSADGPLEDDSGDEAGERPAPYGCPLYGEVIAITEDRLRVRWSDGTIDERGPRSLFVIPEDEDDGADATKPSPAPTLLCLHTGRSEELNFY